MEFQGTYPSAFGERMLVAGARLGRALFSVVVAGWLTYVVAADKPNLEPDVYQATVNLHVAFALLIVAYGGYLLLARRLPGPTHLDWVIAGLIFAYALSTATSVNPRISAEVSLLLAVGVISFYVTHDLRVLSVRAILRVLAGIVALLSLLTLLSTMQQYMEWLRLVEAVQGHISRGEILPPTLPRSQGILDGANTFAMLLGMLLPFFLALALRPVHGLDRPLGGLAVLLGFAALFCTLSRGGWLATAAWLPVFFVLLRSSYDGHGWLAALYSRLPSRRTLSLAAGASVIVLALMAVAIWQMHPPWLFRETSAHVDSVAVAWRILMDRPLTGGGTYTFGLLYDSYGGDFPIYGIYPHNLYMRLLTDVGLIGGLLFLAGAAIHASGLFRALRRASQEQRALLAACSASLVALLVHGLVEAPSSWNTILVSFAITMGVAARLTPPQIGTSRPLRVAPRALIVLLLPLTLAGWWVIDSRHAEYAHSLGLLDSGRVADGAAVARDAATNDAAMAPYHVHAGVSQALAYLAAPEEGSTRDEAQLAGAIQFLKRAAQLDPRAAVSYANLALALQLQGDLDAAAAVARQALVNGPGDATTASIAGNVLESVGLREEAVTAYAMMLSLRPELSQAAYWGSNNERLELRREAVALSGVNACRLGRQGAMYGSYVDDLLQLTEACRSLVVSGAGDAAKRSDLALMLHALGMTEEASTEARRALKQAPAEPPVMVSTAVVLSSERSIEATRMLLLRASELGNGDANIFLALSYGQPSEEGPARLMRTEPGAMPPDLRARLRHLTPGGSKTVEEARQFDGLARQYYRIQFLRQAPDVILIPGEWTQLSSPRIGVLLSLLASP